MKNFQRLLAVFDQPGTTRDSIYIDFERDGDPYTLIDTAGVRRRARINEAIEKFSVIKTLQAMEQANVVLLVLDATTGQNAISPGCMTSFALASRAQLTRVPK